MVVDFPTPQSVSLARAVMLSERARVTAEVGLHFVLIRCPHCLWEADGSGVTEGQAEGHAIKQIVQHIIHEHGGES